MTGAGPARSITRIVAGRGWTCRGWTTLPLLRLGWPPSAVRIAPLTGGRFGPEAAVADAAADPCCTRAVVGPAACGPRLGFCADLFLAILTRVSGVALTSGMTSRSVFVRVKSFSSPLSASI